MKLRQDVPVICNDAGEKALELRAEKGFRRSAGLERLDMAGQSFSAEQIVAAAAEKHEMRLFRRHRAE